MQRYDVVLLDCPPSLGVLSVNALTMAHEVVVPMQAQYLALRGLEKLLETVLLVERSLNPGITVSGVLLCMHESQSSHGRAVVEEIDRYFERHRGDHVPWRDAHVLKPPVRRNIKLAEAPSFGQTIFDYSPKCAGAADYLALARGMLARWRGTKAAAPSAERASPPVRAEGAGAATASAQSAPIAAPASA
jgi:chromosome partitioning protein